jgi:hypothetical protein
VQKSACLTRTYIITILHIPDYPLSYARRAGINDTLFTTYDLHKKCVRSPTYNHVSRTINAVTLQPTRRRLLTSYPSFHLGSHFGHLEWMHYKLTIAPIIITPNSHYTTTLHDILFCNCSESETTEVTYYLLSRNGRIRDSISSQKLHKNLMRVPPALSPQYH